MTMTFDQEPTVNDPVHLLAIADSKVGKSTYASRAAKDGFRLLYIDSDNGASAIRFALKDNPEAMARVHYIRTNHPVELTTGIMKSTKSQPFLWNKTLDRVHSRMNIGHKPDDQIIAFNAKAFPKELLMVQDSWTSYSGDAMGIGADAKSTDILKMAEDGKMNQVYGDAGNRLTLIANLVQQAHYHVATLAHGTVFERYEKPLNKSSRDAKQNEMVLRDIIYVPISSSRPHGHSMVSRWNHIAWLELDKMGNVLIDFTRSASRVGGGPPNREAPIGELPFSRLVDPINGKAPADPGHSTDWLAEFRLDELMPELAKVEGASPQAPATPATMTQKVPAAGVLNNLNLKK